MEQVDGHRLRHPPLLTTVTLATEDSVKQKKCRECQKLEQVIPWELSRTWYVMGGDEEFDSG